DADRCAVAVPDALGWRMLRGDELGALLGDYVMATAAADPADSVVAATVVSSRLLSKLAPARGVRYAETLTGFKWLARAADGTGGRLVYAYEEAIGYCCDPDAVRDKDGISAAVLAAHMVARLGGQGRTLLDVLDGYAVECGLHVTDQLAIRVDDLAEIQAMMARLRAAPPRELAGAPIEVDDLAGRRGPMRTDAVVLRGDATRVVIRPSGTEPKLKAYLEIATPVSDPEELAPRRTAATAALHTLRAEVRSLLGA
ncbi:MAG: phospho-sugar mutase, partial [Mycobacteriaceae bacterium]|nr:phospho-sugar mutase [Mycobacteriaceae bacterium]